MPNIGPTELIILLVIVLVIFGPKRLPGLGKQLGAGMRDFKEAVTSRHDDDDDEDERPALTAAATDASDTPASVAVPTPAAKADRSGLDA
jgi:sec-independent protein translocase protein TatA